ncbi:MAG: nodulation protein NfeD [Chloroflexia bacterium]|nr:nodulation protein NfeD [Chloroflexia bacterium]
MPAAPKRRSPPAIQHGGGVVAFFLLLCGVALAAVAPAVSAQVPDIAVIQLDGAITPPMARYVEGAMGRAAADGAVAVVLEIDTPGGLTTAMDSIIDSILASEVPVIAHVAPNGARAASAGVFITYAAHIAAMAPGTRIGSASPVLIGESGTVSDDDTMTAKITNDAVSQIKNLATLRNRNAEWAEQAVREAVNITAEEALRLDVIDLVAADLETLLTEIDGRTVELASGPVTLATAGAQTSQVQMGWLDQLLHLLSDPTIAYILLSLGSLGLILELSNPGAVFPGVVGGLSLLVALYGLGTLPVNWAGLLLIGFAFLLFALDLFLPSFGTLTIGGIIAFVFGSHLLVGGNVPGFEIAPAIIWTMTALLIGFFVFIGGSVMTSAFRRPVTGREAMIGTIGVVRQPLAPDGMIFATGELWQASLQDRAEQGLPAGTPVTVTAIDALRLIVRPATAAEAASAGVVVIDDRPPAVPAAPTGVEGT